MLTEKRERELLRIGGVLMLALMAAIVAGVCTRSFKPPDPEAASPPEKLGSPLDDGETLGRLGREGFVSYAASATVTVGASVELHFGFGSDDTEGNDVASCSYTSPLTDPGWASGSTLTGIFRPQDARRTPRLEFTDDGLGSIIGLVAERDREWLLTQPGSASVTVFDPRRPDDGPQFLRLYKDDDGRWLVRDAVDGERPDGAFFELEAHWAGVGTDNFTSEDARVDVRIQCLFVSRLIAEYLDRPALEVVVGMKIPETTTSTS